MRGKKASPGVRNSLLCQREMKLKPRLVCDTVVAPHWWSQARSGPEEEPTPAQSWCQMQLPAAVVWVRTAGGEDACDQPQHGDSLAQAGQGGLAGHEAGAQQVAGAGGGEGRLTVKEETQVPQAWSPRAQTLWREIYWAEHSRSCKHSMAITKTLLQEWPWSHALLSLQRPLSWGIPDVEIQILTMWRIWLSD